MSLTSETTTTSSKEANDEGFEPLCISTSSYPASVLNSALLHSPSLHISMEVVEVYPTNCISIHAYFESLSFPPMFSIGQLLGKSNFKVWRASIEPALLKNPYSSKLILGEWDEPKVQASASQTEAELDQARKDWQFANTATCRFIRATLALNVTPFVRQHSTAKALYLNLIWLYGGEAGIDTQGGPPVPSNAKTGNPQTNRASLLAALESDKPLGDVTSLASMLQAPSGFASSNSSTTSLLLKSPTSSIVATGSKRPDSQTLPVKYLQELAAQRPQPPPPRIHIYERTRISPDASLETIHEEPHPGRRVSLSRGADSAKKSMSVSPVTSSDVSDDDDIDLSPVEDIDNETHAAKNKHGEGDTAVGIRAASTSLFGTITPKQKQSRTHERFSFSSPLRRLNRTKTLE